MTAAHTTAPLGAPSIYLAIENVDNEWSIGLIPDGRGFHFTAVKVGVLWASGWLRCEDGAAIAKDMALATGKLAEERAR